jgi:16S rRNA (cytosine(967)-C(5))-methyltransferase
MKIFRQYHIIKILEEQEKQNMPLDAFLSDYFRKHKAIGSKDRTYISDTSYGIIRWKSLLDFLSSYPSNWEKRVELFCRYSSVEELMNDYKTLSIPNHIKVSFPAELFDLIAASYGVEEAMNLCLVSNQAAPTTIRVNVLKIARDALLKKWKGQYAVKPTTQSAEGIVFEKRQNFLGMEEFKAGYFEVQDECSQLVAQHVKALPGQHVLDYCAGSGGKTLAIAVHMNNLGQIYLHDIRQSALQQAKLRLKRAGIQNAQIFASGNPQLNKLKGKMDWVLVDVPCSGTGTMRRNPDMKWRFSESMLESLVKQQQEIFEKGLAFLKKTGKIVYATCSILQQENEEQIKFFLSKYNLELDEPLFKVLPKQQHGDGFFAAILKQK